LRHRRDWRAEDQQLDRDVRGAAEVQRRLLPQSLPNLITADCAAACEPALGVGGDYYDFIDLAPGLTAFVLADVAGKGITAALTMASLHGMLRAEAPRYKRRAAELMTAMNAALHTTLAPGKFVTLFYGVYDDGNRSLTYVNAGHPPPMLIHTPVPQSIVNLDACVPPLGLFPSLAAVDVTVQFEQGDWLLVFSDGATEALNTNGDEFGRAGLLDTALQHTHLSVGSMRDVLRGAIRCHATGRPQSDDVTLLVAKIA
jgi:sigma-B regulation protein RsbU (phosphoserine phosphatase)